MWATGKMQLSTKIRKVLDERGVGARSGDHFWHFEIRSLKDSQVGDGE